MEYYFEIHNDCQVHAEVWRADVDKYHLIRFILYIIQQRFAENVIRFIAASSEDDLRRYSHNYEGSFAPIQNYVQFLYLHKDDSNALNSAIQLGTGKLSNKRDFARVGIEPLTDYNRHEVLAFFLNLLAANRFYLLICIDEMEKLQERSKTRFQNFLTSFRELIDLSSFVSGHMLMIAMTDSTGKTGVPLESYNPALARRVNQYVYSLDSIRKREELFFLVNAMREALLVKEGDTDEIVNKLRKNSYSHTNEYVISAYQYLLHPEKKSWKDYIKEGGLSDLLKKKYQELEEDEIRQNIHTKFFSPVETYCEMISQSLDDYTLKVQQYQCVRNNNQSHTFVFLFNNDVEANCNRVLNVYNMNPTDKLFVFKPESLDLTYDDLKERINIDNIEIVSYNPVELIALLELYQDEYENEFNSFKEIEINNDRFLLVHSLPENYKGDSLDCYSIEQIIFSRFDIC